MSACLKLPPLSLYIHVPWCLRKCPYCDFNSQRIMGSIPEQAYVNALLADLEQELEAVQDRTIQSIFIGGGTPSLLSPKAYENLFNGIDRRLTISTSAEITLEVNPSTLEQAKFQAFAALGINRLSIGVQSLQADKLEALGRTHSPQQAMAALETALALGYNYNVDLMYGLPNQSPADALEDLALASEFKPAHMSWYQLTIEPNTQFYSHPPALPKEDSIAAMQQQGYQWLANQGYERYEISAYAQANQASWHNLNYWRFGDYIGIGAGAHGKLTDLTNRGIKRTWKTRSAKDYLARDKSFLAGSRWLTPAELPLEYLMNGLRLIRGISVAGLENYAGTRLAQIKSQLDMAVNRGLLIYNKDKITTTELGLNFLNDCLQLFN